MWWCRFVGWVWQGSYCFIAALMVLRGCFDGFSWLRAGFGAWRATRQNRDKTAHDVKKCAISCVMLLNFLAYMYFCGARACIFLKRPYLCIVFFIVLDLRLTRLGYSGIPFFLSLRQDAPLCEG